MIEHKIQSPSQTLDIDLADQIVAGVAPGGEKVRRKPRPISADSAAAALTERFRQQANTNFAAFKPDGLAYSFKSSFVSSMQPLIRSIVAFFALLEMLRRNI
jgi:hypothetical protein